MQLLTSRIHKVLVFQNSFHKKLFKKFYLCNNKNTKLIYGSGVNFKSNDEKIIHNKKSNKIEIILVTRILKEKGILKFLEIAEYFNKNSADFYFSLIGGVEEQNKYLKIIIEQTEKRLKNFRWFGKLAKEKVEKLLKESNIFLYPSTYSEGIPRVLLEAANANLYIISYDIPGCNEIIINKVNGELVDTKESIDSFINAIKRYDKNMNNEITQFNKVLIKKKFDLKVIAESYISVYKEIINEKY